jgi:L-2-amino-thiazoline-4-carboxylic acid hydrolase
VNQGDEFGILARRKIEAAVIAPIYDEMRKALGQAKAREILGAAIPGAAVAAGAEMAKRAPGGADLESFKSTLAISTFSFTRATSARMFR